MTALLFEGHDFLTGKLVKNWRYYFLLPGALAISEDFRP
jgi:hypothetical protein